MSMDNTILELKADIVKKKANLKSSKRFNPITNCSLELDGFRYNLHVQNKNELYHLLVKLNSYAESARALGILKQYIMAGFAITDWIADIQARITHINHNTEITKLKAMELRLTKLLSREKQVELEVSEISDLLTD